MLLKERYFRVPKVRLLFELTSSNEYILIIPKSRNKAKKSEENSRNAKIKC